MFQGKNPRNILPIDFNRSEITDIVVLVRKFSSGCIYDTLRVCSWLSRPASINFKQYCKTIKFKCMLYILNILDDKWQMFIGRVFGFEWQIFAHEEDQQI